MVNIKITTASASARVVKFDRRGSFSLAPPPGFGVFPDVAGDAPAGLEVVAAPPDAAVALPARSSLLAAEPPSLPARLPLRARGRPRPGPAPGRAVGRGPGGIRP
ncbi:MAG TPA: hypothetical protein VIT65_27240 [Microlunatus sp.]